MEEFKDMSENTRRNLARVKKQIFAMMKKENIKMHPYILEDFKRCLINRQYPNRRGAKASTINAYGHLGYRVLSNLGYKILRPYPYKDERTKSVSRLYVNEFEKILEHAIPRDKKAFQAISHGDFKNIKEFGNYIQNKPGFLSDKGTDKAITYQASYLAFNKCVERAGINTEGRNISLSSLTKGLLYGKKEDKFI